MYEFGIMAYDVAVIRCIVVALERNMSCPWLIEKMQILKKILKHSLSPIKYRTFATERVLWVVMQMSFNSRRRLLQPIELTPLSHRADSVIQ